ncbi:hypothetical protein [Rugamonas sp.]|uniref:hypothetical protein n=1 Tax=Rugamonas sp. TaxID=1926287 RepID=UPI0025ED9BAE|nr:hypothetical protein [Rugamonas sp.]
MIQITLALPFGLPPPELAPDLQRALKTPALAALLSRTSNAQVHPAEDGARALPHEAWLARALGLLGSGAQADGAPVAAAAMHGYGQAPSEGYWFIVQPIHVQLARTHLTLADPRQLRLEEADARTLFELAQPLFEESGKPLVYGDAGTWFMRADDWADLSTATPDTATSMNLSDWMPEGPNAIAFRKLQNEIQMLWHEHAVNEARQARGLTPVNSFWLWGGAAAPAPATAARKTLAVAGAPAWLAALGRPSLRGATLAQLLAHPADGDDQGPRIALLGDLMESGGGGDWSDWLMHMQRLEQDWFAPLLAALHDGRVARVKLVLSHRTRLAEFTSTKNAQRKFWRKHTLNNLVPS